MPRVFTVHTPLGPETLKFQSLTGQEQLSRLFEFRLDMLSQSPDLSVDSLLGQNVTIEMETKDQGRRYLNGEVTRFALIGRDGRFYRYEAIVRPWMWYMTRGSDCKIFQQMDAPSILAEVFSRYPSLVDYRLTAPYRTWEYCVQYQETDFNFVSRLMEHEGIYYYFEHAMGQLTLVLADSIGAHKPLPQYASIPYISAHGAAIADEEHVESWIVSKEVDPGGYVTDDYDFKKPRAKLQQLQNHAFEHPNAEYKIFDYPGGYTELPDGELYAKVRLEELQTSHEVLQGQSNARGLAPGYLFNLYRCPRADQNREYLIVGINYFWKENPYSTAGEEGTVFQFTASCQDSALPYRPHRITPKPLTNGPQTAVVVGPAGEEIYTDKYGRVKVQFRWDRYGTADENSSCWIRVSSSWAGSNWGQISLPRIGQEVIVDFINGDPDYPIIIGRIYNADHMPPYELPKYQEYSTIKSRSTKKGGNNDWNEMRFVDYKGKEQVFIHCQRRMDVRVKWNKYETVKEASHFLMGTCYMTAGGEFDIYAGGDFYTQTKGSQYSQQKSDFHTKAGGDSKHLVTSAHEMNARSIIIEAAKSVVLKCAGSYVEVSPMGVTIQGPLVQINPGGSTDGTSSVKLGDAEHAASADTGEPGYLDRPYRGGGGGSRWHTENGYHSRAVTYNSADGSFTYGGSGITVKGDPAFCDKTLQTLGGLDSTPTGKKLIDNLQDNGKKGKGVTIEKATHKEAVDSGGGLTQGDGAWQNGFPAGPHTFTDQNTGNPFTVNSDGSGTSSTVKYEPGFGSNYTDPSKTPPTTFSDPDDETLLGHELMHADHNGKGTNLQDVPDPKDPTGNQEESQTIGINDHKDNDISENNLMKDLGKDFHRTDHDSHAAPNP